MIGEILLGIMVVAGVPAMVMLYWQWRWGADNHVSWSLAAWWAPTIGLLIVNCFSPHPLLLALMEIPLLVQLLWHLRRVHAPLAIARILVVISLVVLGLLTIKFPLILWWTWSWLLATVIFDGIDLLMTQRYRPLLILTGLVDLLVLAGYWQDDALGQVLLILVGLAFWILTALLLDYLFHETDVVFAQSLDKMMASYTAEVQNLYNGMRGWRHDYHDHLQALKVYLDQGQLDEIRAYLNGLEDKLDAVDPVVHSGNSVLDAVVNAKLTIAKNNRIPYHVKAFVGTQPLINPIDLVVIVGNLMDNAIEAIQTQQPGEKKIFRVYISILKQQLYISVTNSRPADQQIDIHYASTKNDKRGLGIRRINHLVAKYHGVINRQYQAGVFATEVMLPLNQVVVRKHHEEE